MDRRPDSLSLSGRTQVTGVNAPLRMIAFECPLRQIRPALCIASSGKVIGLKTYAAHSLGHQALNSPLPWPSPLRAWYAVAVLVLAFILSFVDRIVIALLVEPIKADLGISDFGIGLLQGFAFALFYALLGIPIGRLSDRVSRRGHHRHGHRRSGA